MLSSWSRPLSSVVVAMASTLVLGCQGSTTPSANSTPPSKGASTKTNAATIESLSKVTTVQGDRMANASDTPVTLSKQTEPSPFRFEEVAKASGIDFVHFSGMSKDKHFPTANGSGIGMFDYDGDGNLDLYFASATVLPLGSGTSGPNRLYKNLGNGKFQDVTEGSGLGFQGFCHGIVVGDVDNDGDQDVFLCNYGSNALYLNDGHGKFTDISKTAGIDAPNWSSGGVFFDYDNDGDLDLYVANYGEWRYPEDDLFCGDREKHVRLYCSPRSIKTVKHILYRNNGNATFTDVTDAAGVGRSDGHGFAAVAADLNEDGKIDLYVTNDMNPNFLYLNKGDGTFEDATEGSGAAYDEKGQAQSGMGVDAEDVNGDGRPELFVTNFANEYNTLYQNLGKGSFMDMTPYFGLASDTLPWVGWGTALADFDNDGWPDNFVANGQVDDNRRLIGQNVEYEELALLFHNKKGERFRLATLSAGAYFDQKHVGRGAAFGDFDDDGDIDIVVNHKDAPAALLRNDSQTSNHWIRLDLRGTRSNRDAIGTQIEVVAGALTIKRQRKSGYSLMSSNDPRVLVGIGAATQVSKLTLRWPSGEVTTQENLKADQSYSFVEPAGDSKATAVPKPNP
ncbi:CRTAC1 family protein [Singulisphaera rosea]